MYRKLIFLVLFTSIVLSCTVKENIIDSEFTKVKQIVELLNSEDVISYNFDTNKFEISKAFMRKYCEKKIRNYAKQLEHDNKTSLSHLVIDFT